MIWKNTALRNELQECVKKNKEITDIILFGSLTRGKEKPNDIDILVLFNKIVDKNEEYKIRKILEKYYDNISIISKTIKTVIDPAFDARESILFEGKSLLSQKNLAETYGFFAFGLFKYHFNGWNKLKKTKFYYALNGRNEGEGMAKKLECIKIADQALLVPREKIDAMEHFLHTWDMAYKYIPLLLPKRMSKKNILEGS